MTQEQGEHFLTRLASTPLDLPFTPKLLQTLFMQTRDDGPFSLEDVARTIAHDQGLTTRILTMANSAYYGLQSQVTSIARAIAVLGLKQIRTIVLALAVRALACRGLPPDFDLAVYWRHQLLVAQTARDLARRHGVPDPEGLFTAGMLHDLGKLIIAQRAPQDWLAINRLILAEELPAAEAEDRHWGLDHGVVGALVLKAWNLPQELTEPINWHHDPDLSPDNAAAARCLCLADALVNWSEGGDGALASHWRNLAGRLSADPEGDLALALTAASDASLAAFIGILACAA